MKKILEKSSFRKKSDFLTKTYFSIEISMKIDFSKNRFSLTFQWKNIFRQKITKNIFIFIRRFFFISKKIFLKIFFYLYRSKISPGFQKSYLENRAMSLKMRTRLCIIFLPNCNKTHMESC